MSRKYKFHDSSVCHFVSFATVHWIDVFTRRNYLEVMVESLEYCIQNKGLLLNAWCIMPNHVHLIIRPKWHKSPLRSDLRRFMVK
ncbi:MAG: transposase [Bacteroidota bacterium]